MSSIKRWKERGGWARAGVVLAATVLFVLWVGLHVGDLTSTQNGWIRFGLTAFFSLLVLLRPNRRPVGRGLDDIVLPAVFCGVLLSASGLFLGIRQFEWLGLLLMLFGCLQWGLPERVAVNVWRALFLLYWAHPLPNRFFEWLQLAMQRLSVLGAEWMLHVLNVRVWVDGLVLRTGFSTYEIPAWCSGMRTATTAFLVGLGLGLAKRLRAYQIGVVIVLATVQALVLNIIRIAVMVLVSRAQPEAAIEFLHDSTGVIVLGAVFLVYLELAFWERRRRRAAARTPNPEAKHVRRALTTHPPFWWTVVEHKWAVLSGLVGLLVVAGLVFKSRSYHRAEMVKDVALSLRASGHFEDSQRAAESALRRVPRDDEWRLELVRILLVRERYEDVLTRLDEIPDQNESRVLEKRVLQAYSLMGLERIDEASALVNALPEALRQDDPRVAMIMAEMGVYGGNPEQAGRYAVVAIGWGPNARRVRRLYPYLRRHKQWAAIVESDSRVAYRRSIEAMCVAEAYMNLDDTAELARVLDQAYSRWPNDPRLIEPLYYLAIKRRLGKWEDRFAEHVRRCLPLMNDPDLLAAWFPRCFGMTRPDLAWAVYGRIQDIDSDHPSLDMAVVRFGHHWFTFSRAFLGLKARSPDETVSLAPFYRIGLQLNDWSTVYGWVPEGRLAVPDTLPVRQESLEAALAEFRRRDERDALTRHMHDEYIRALEIAGDVDEARRQLARLDEKYPRDRERHRTRLSEIHERSADWQQVYEMLRGYPSIDVPHLSPLIRLCEAQLRLKMGLPAMVTAWDAARRYPQFGQAAAYLAAALMEHDSFAEALLVLGRPRIRDYPDMNLLEAECLYRTQRYKEWERFCEATRLRHRMPDADVPQDLVLPPAELAALWHWISLPSDPYFAEAAERLRKNLADTTIPFVTDMGPLWLGLYEGKADSATLRSWLACGRDRTEKAVAANQLTLLLCRAERFDEARRAAEKAVELLPESPLLWRILISLSRADRDVIARAREACPDDSEIWLAALVADGGASAADIERAAAAGRYTPEAMTRAAEYLYRNGRHDAAAAAARDATARARSLVPAYVQGVRCALAVRDRVWALACTQEAVRSSLRVPPRFYKTLVELKAGEDGVDVDADMIAALKALRAEEPDNPHWAEMLGFVRFKRGGWEFIDSLNQMTAALEKGATGPQPYLIAAEASRLLGNIERAVELLRRGRAQYPDNVPLLNNLVYTLSQHTDGAPAAMVLTPLLMEAGGDDPVVLDTIAHAYVSAGAYEKADDLLVGILSQAAPGSCLWFRARTLEARVALARDKVDMARTILDGILARSRGIPDEDLMRASRLRAEVEAETRR